MRSKNLVIAISLGLGFTVPHLGFAQSVLDASKMASNTSETKPLKHKNAGDIKAKTKKSSQEIVGKKKIPAPSDKKSEGVTVPKKNLVTGLTGNTTGLIGNTSASDLKKNNSDSKTSDNKNTPVSSDKKAESLDTSGKKNTTGGSLDSAVTTTTAPTKDSSKSSTPKEKANDIVPDQNDKKFLADFSINGDDKGTQFFLESNGKILIDARALSRALGKEKDYVEGEPGVQKIKTRLFVDPKLNIPGSKLSLDDKTQKVSLVLPGAAFSSSKVYLNKYAPVPAPISSPSAFLNYSISSEQTNIGSAYVSSGITAGSSALLTSYTWNKLNHWQRGATSFQKDDVKHLVRYTVGDQYAYSSDGLGGSTGLAGIGVQRAFDLDPYLVTIPQPKISGILQAPGTLEIYENGRLMGTRAVGAGPFNLENMGVGVGTTNLSVIIRDPFGGTRQINQNFYAIQNTLGEGLTDFSYQIGIQSPVLGQTYHATQPVFLARQRWSLKNKFTVGYRFEGEKDLYNGGGSLDFGGKFGGVHLALGGSKSKIGGNGWAENLGYSYSGRRFTFSIGGSEFSKGYRKLGDASIEQALRQSFSQIGLNIPGLPTPTIPYNSNNNNLNLSLDPNQILSDQFVSIGTLKNNTIQAILASQRPRTQFYGSFGYSPFNKFLIQTSYSKTTYADGHINQSESLGASYDLKWASLYGGLNKSKLGTFKDKSIIFTLTIPLGSNIATVSDISTAGSSSKGLDFQKSLPSGSGFGYSGHFEQNGGSGSQMAGNISGQNNYGRLNVQLYKTSFGTSESADLAGSVVLIGKEIHFARPLTGGYALVNVGEGLKGIPVIHENQEVGTTNSHGSVLVTNMLSYQRNQLGFKQSAVPAAYVIPVTEKIISIPRYGGAVVKFGVHKLRAIRGVLKDSTGKPLSAGTIVALIGKSETLKNLNSPMGSRGNFYLDNVIGGDYTIQARHSGILYNCPIMVPVDKRPIYNLKTISCKIK